MTEPTLGMILEVTGTTLLVCGSALFVALLLGVPLGVWLGSRRFPGRAALVSVVNSGMGAPPVVVGLLVALLLWRNQPLGFLELMYTRSGIVVAQILIALPLITAITLAAVASLDEEWDLQVRTLGVSRLYRLWLLLREIRPGVLAAVIAGLGGILSEVGAVMLVGGNLEGETRVLTTAILMHASMGEFETALGLAAVLLGLMLLLTGMLTLVQQVERR